MNWKSTSDRYGRVAVLIHWASALLILALLASGLKAANTTDPAAQLMTLRIHVVLGLSMTALTLARLGWWLVDAKPALATGTGAIMARAAKTVHASFYMIILGMVATGIGMTVVSGAGAILFAGTPGILPDFWSYPPRGLHRYGAWALLTLFVPHAGAALYHQFVKRDGLLRRMALS